MRVPEEGRDGHELGGAGAGDGHEDHDGDEDDAALAKQVVCGCRRHQPRRHLPAAEVSHVFNRVQTPDLTIQSTWNS